MPLLLTERLNGGRSLLRGIDTYNAETETAIVASIAAAAGVDASEVDIESVAFPVTASVALKNVTAVQFRAELDVSFRTGIAADLAVSEDRVVVTSVTATTRRRGLLETPAAAAAGDALAVAFEVSGATHMAAALRLSYSVLKATTSDTSALKVNLVSGGLPAAAVSVGLHLTGVKAKPVASLYTRKRHGPTGSVCMSVLVSAARRRWRWRQWRRWRHVSLLSPSSIIHVRRHSSQ